MGYAEVIQIEKEVGPLRQKGAQQDSGKGQEEEWFKCW
jgi:hypothetical protein